jgi:hypothetical protein
MGPIGCPETSVRNYHYTLRNNPEEHSSPFLSLIRDVQWIVIGRLADMDNGGNKCGQISWNIKLRRLRHNWKNTATVNRQGKEWGGMEDNEMTQR